MDKSVDRTEKNHIENELLNPEHKAGTDWFTKLVTVEKAKAIRREAQRPGKASRLRSPDITVGRGQVSPHAY